MIVVSVIQLDKLSKSYRNNKQTVSAVDDLSFTVEQGQIFGFLGPNGAGKTTTIRMLLGLVHPTGGQAYLFGTPLNRAQQLIHTRIGALVEDATLYPFMTGYDNLKTIAYTNNLRNLQRIDKVLDIVGMSAFAKRKAKTYSTGMKQRLGIASALLNDPDLLILDEPSNGLDPQGIQDVRSLLKHLAQNEGKTIFLSSHLLHEVEQLCDHVAIIRQGKLIKTGAVSDLLQSDSVVALHVNAIAQAHDLLSQTYPTQISDERLVVTIPQDKVPEMISTLVAHNIRIYEVTPQQQTLENLFLEAIHD